MHSDHYSTIPIFPELLTAVLTKGSRCRFQAKGHSMSPFIKDGDVLTISPFINSSISFGRTVASIHPQTGKLVIHRVVGKNGNHYLTKGDNSLETDGLVPRENILGFVSRIERNGKDVFLGLGMERFVIAFFSRRRLLFFVLWCRRRILLSIRRFVYEEPQ